MGRSSGNAGNGGRPGEKVVLQTVSLNDRQVVTYAEYGTPTGTPVLFLHGTPGSHLLGQLLHEDAKQCDVRLLAPNRPGYGESTPLPDRTLSDTGKFLAAVMADAEIPQVRVVGFSGGGPHALALAATHQELVDEIDIISGTTPPSLMDTVPPVQRVLGLLAQRTPLLLGGLFRAQAAIAEHASPGFIVSQYTSSDTSVEISGEVGRLVKRDFIEAFACHRSGAVTESRLFSQEWDVPLNTIETRVRFWHGTRDGIVPIQACERLKNALPNGRLIPLEGADHLTSLLLSKDETLKSRIPSRSR